MNRVIEIKEKCQSCGGTGLYVGMGERDGAAVVCHTCSGSGCHVFKHEYEDFVQREARSGVVQVYESNPGICIGAGKSGYALADFGGMPIKKWLAGSQFVLGMENRRFTCPAWWYQGVEYALKPFWKECEDMPGCSFSSCKHFCDKKLCWERFDREHPELK